MNGVYSNAEMTTPYKSEGRIDRDSMRLPDVVSMLEKQIQMLAEEIERFQQKAAFIVRPFPADPLAAGQPNPAQSPAVSSIYDVYEKLQRETQKLAATITALDV